MPRKNERELDDVRKCISVLSAVVNCNQLPVKNSKFDVIAVITRSLIANLTKFKLEWTETLATQVSSDCWPSTSNAPEGTIVDDPRVRLGYLLSEIFTHLAKVLTICKNSVKDEYTILSVNEQGVVIGGAQFFVLAQLVPYLDTGVGIPVHKRSNFVKAWKPINESVITKRSQIIRFLDTLRELLESNESLKREILKCFLSDIICALEQVIHFEGEPIQWVEDLLSSISQITLVIVLMSLSKTYDPNIPPPPWFTVAIGDRLSNVLRSPEGLFNTLGACFELGGEEFWLNSHILARVARQLILPSKNVKRMGYFENMNKQFISVFQKSVYPEDGMIRLYSFFIDEMATSYSLAGDVFVLDKLIKIFEVLKESSIECFEWSENALFAIHLLSLFSDANRCPQLLLNSPRYMQIFPIILGFLSSECFDKSEDTCLNQLAEDIQNILKFISKRIENLGQLLLSFVLSADEDLFRITFKKSLVVPVDKISERLIALKHIKRRSDEEYITLKLDAVLKFLMMVDQDASNSLIIEILCESVDLWTASENVEDEPRFCGELADSSESQYKREASHLVAHFCFEHLGEREVDPKNKSVVKSLSRFIELILKKAIEWMQEQDKNAQSFDVCKKQSDTDLEIIEIQQVSTKMAVGLAAGIITAGTVESVEFLPSIAKSVAQFVAAVSTTKSDQFAEIAEDGKQILQLFNILGLKEEIEQVSLPKSTNKSSNKQVDPIKQLQEDLDDEMVPVRGEALIRVSKAVRKKDKRVISILDEWLFSKVKELVEDSDSYVFLAAINALAEIACYKPNKYLEELLKIFEELGEIQRNKLPEEKDSIVAQRGKMAEVIGKVFRVLGDLAPSWIRRSSNTFLTSLKDEHDIIRASSLSAFSELIGSCEGRGLESILIELFFAVDCILKTDKCYLVRRAAVHMIRAFLSSCGEDIVNTLGENLINIRRELMRLYRYDPDYVVRLHAELCLDDIGRGLKTEVEEEMNSRLRVINIK